MAWVLQINHSVEAAVDELDSVWELCEWFVASYDVGCGRRGQGSARTWRGGGESEESVVDLVVGY